MKLPIENIFKTIIFGIAEFPINIILENAYLIPTFSVNLLFLLSNWFSLNFYPNFNNYIGHTVNLWHSRLCLVSYSINKQIYFIAISLYFLQVE